MTDEHDTTDPLADDAQPADSPDDDGRAIPDGDVADPAGPAGSAPAADPTGPTGTDADDGWFDSGVERKLKGAGAVVLGLIATWATFQVYFSLSRSIEIWFSRDFVPVFQAAFNLIVVLVAVAGIVWLVRELA